MFPRSRLPPRTLGGVVLAVGLLVAGCGALPTSGPTADQVISQQARDDKAPFTVIDIDQRVVATLQARPQPSLRAHFPHHGAPPEPLVGVGDSLSVTIWEAASGGLFTAVAGDQTAPGSHSVVLPEQVVGRDGAISVPFAGRVAAAGRRPVDVQHGIERRLSGKAIDPQAIVSVIKSVNDTATVTGDVIKGERVALSLKGDRLLDLIAACGGTRAPVHETAIRLSRGGKTVTIPMQALVTDPAENIYAEPGDVVTVMRAPQTFTVFGAAGQNSEIDFPAAELTLVEALAKAGGLQDFRSDPAGVFLFRWEQAAIPEALGYKAGEPGPDGRVPVVYRLDLSNAKAYFAAERFPVRDKDVLYIANAGSIELEKFLQLINGLTGPAVTGAVVKNATQ